MKPVRIKFIPSSLEIDNPDVARHGSMGYFYCWGNDVEVIADQVVVTTRAIVSDDGGNVDMVFPMNVRFLDSPPDVLIANLLRAADEKDPKSAIVQAVNEFYRA